MRGAGYAICQGIIRHWYDQIDISLSFEDLYDSKTKLKELFDFYGSKDRKINNYSRLKKLEYFCPEDEWKKNNRNEARLRNLGFSPPSPETRIQSIVIYCQILNERTWNYEEHELGRGSAALKADASQRAAKTARETLRRKGYWKPIPAEYEVFENGERFEG
jgi:hypothetical protein